MTHTRLLTCFLYAGKFSFHTIINLHLLTQVSSRYEKMGVICTRRRPNDGEDEQQNNNEQQQQQQQRRQSYTSPYYERGETSDYIFCILFGMIGILVSHVYLLPKLPYSITHNQFHRFFQRHLTFYIVYIWSKQHPNNMVNFFGMPFAAAYLPYAYLLMGYAMNNQKIPVDILHGMFIGHVFFYAACIVPRVLGRSRAVIYTPVILVDLCHWLEGVVENDDNGGVAPPLPDVDGIIGG